MEHQAPARQRRVDRLGDRPEVHFRLLQGPDRVDQPDNPNLPHQRRLDEARLALLAGLDVTRHASSGLMATGGLPQYQSYHSSSRRISCAGGRRFGIAGFRSSPQAATSGVGGVHSISPVTPSDQTMRRRCPPPCSRSEPNETADPGSAPGAVPPLQSHLSTHARRPSQ